MATLQVQTREGANSAEVRRLRSKGILPMALIAKGQETRLIQAPMKEVRSVLQMAHGVPVFGVTLDSDKAFKAVVKDVQRDSISRAVTHITLQEVKDDDMIKISVPVHTIGEPECVAKKKSSLVIAMSTIEIFAKPGDIPEAINVDVSKMGEHDKVVVSDIAFPAGVTTHASPDAVVVTTTILRAVSLEAPKEGEVAAGAEAAADGEAGAKESGDKK